MPVIRQFGFILLFGLITTSFAYAADDDDDAQESSSFNVQALIELDETAQKLAGIETEAAQRQHYRPEYLAHGKVLDITPLLMLRQQYLSAASQYDSAKAQLKLSGQSMSRLQNLHRHEAVSTRRLQEQQSQWQSVKVIADTASQQRQLILADSLQHWGQTLTDWFTEPSSIIVDDIIAHRSQLLQITLPAGRSLPETVDTIQVTPDGQNTELCRLVAAAPRVDPLTQGRQYFFLLDKTNLPTGLHLIAHIPAQRDSLEGVFIPRSALLWHLGQAHVFIKVNDEQFEQRPIKDYLKSNDGYFVTDAISPGETIVSRGAQMLLSHQLRGQIPDEDDDD